MRSLTNYRTGWPVLRAFSVLRQQHRDGMVSFYLVSIMEDNRIARRFLERGLPGMPKFQPYVRMHSHAIPTARRKPDLPLPAGLTMDRGNADRIDGIIACLQRNGARRQFSPYWSRDNLFTANETPGLKPEDFFLAVRDDYVVACLATWDQRVCKQIVVRGYNGALAHWRWAVNLGGCLMGWPRLPAVNSTLVFRFVSHQAVDNDDPDIFCALLRAAHNQTVENEYDYLFLGLIEQDSLRAVVKTQYRSLDIPSQIYLVAYEDERGVLEEVDDRLPYLEIATL